MPFHQLIDLCQIYLLIFTLPKLKYLKIISHQFKDPVPLPFATDNQQLSMIEHLIIDYSITFSELAAILSYIPKVYHLNFWHRDINYPLIQMISTIALSKLTHTSMNISFLEFDEFEIFLSKLPSTLKSFNLVYTEKELEYLDFDMSEQLILQNFPQLEKFYFNYTVYTYDEDEFIFDGCVCDQFISSFWINRQLLLNLRSFLFL
ncbi:unnamed protein product [Adineta steineri]|uniref:F-box domain-containing protein n=1 Tax=Adineta steineri TaxID=433720 RepID=A0A814IK86_9BILA|nr:unnamed protein product [Adineta steineri]CAF1044933.1 unnamed protein product [Adineta steineri]